MPNKKPKQTIVYDKICDAIVEIEVAMKRLRDNLETGFRNGDTYAEVDQAVKSLDKLHNYVIKLPLENKRNKSVRKRS